jgi:hypothetical protein
MLAKVLAANSEGPIDIKGFGPAIRVRRCREESEPALIDGSPAAVGL